MIQNTYYWIITIFLVIFIPFIGIIMIIYGLLANNNVFMRRNNNEFNSSFQNLNENNEKNQKNTYLNKELFNVEKEIITLRYKEKKISKEEYFLEIEKLKKQYDVV